MPDTPSPFRYAIGDLGPARRHIERILGGLIAPSAGVLCEIENSLNRCVRRLEAMDEAARLLTARDSERATNSGNAENPPGPPA